MIEPTVFFGLQYGLFLLSTKLGDKDNASVINTAIQVTDNPKKMLIAVNKSSYNCEIINETGVFNLSILNEKVTFDTFKQFGFVSGRDVDKFAGMEIKRAENGIAYFDCFACGYISVKVTDKMDVGTHMVFVGEVTEAVKLNDEKSVTYAYYHSNIKTAPTAPKKKGYVCKICNYVYEGDELPADFVCPICKHGADDFEEIK